MGCHLQFVRRHAHSTLLQLRISDPYHRRHRRIAHVLRHRHGGSNTGWHPHHTSGHARSDEELPRVHDGHLHARLHSVLVVGVLLH